MKPKILIDKLGGELPGKIFYKMPYGSEMLIVGNLDYLAPVELNSLNMIMHQKIVRGLYIKPWLQ